MWRTYSRSWSGTSLLMLALGAAALCSRPTLAQPALYSYVTICGDEGVESSDGTNRDIRFYSLARIVFAIAGSVDGTNKSALFRGPADMAVDSAGNLFVADWGNHEIRKISQSGTGADWMTPGLPVMATNGVVSASDLSSRQERRFYRVVLLP